MLTPPPQTEEGRHKAQLWLRLMRGGRARCAPSSGGGRQQPSELISSLLFFALLRPMTVKGQMATMAPGCAANRPSSCRLALIRMRSDCGWMAVWWRFDGGLMAVRRSGVTFWLTRWTTASSRVSSLLLLSSWQPTLPIRCLSYR